MKPKIALVLAALGMTALPQTAAAQVSDNWQFRALIYGYFPDISGRTKFPPRSGGSDIDVGIDTILDNLKFVFFGTFEAQKGRWGFLTDVMYLDVGGSKSQTRDLAIGGIQLPANVTADLDLDVKGTIWTLAGTYRVAADPTATVDVLAGARLIDLKQSLGWNFSADLGPNQPSRTGDAEAKQSNWDGIIGVKGRLAFGANREWFVPYYADVGTGQSDLTWQVVGGLGYAFSWGEILGGWRYLAYDFKSSARLEDVNFSGPFAGVAFRW